MHTCHWPGCTIECVPAHWACIKHWAALPEYLRIRIWASYRIGQETTGHPSKAYLEAEKEVLDWINR